MVMAKTILNSVFNESKEEVESAKKCYIGLTYVFMKWQAKKNVDLALARILYEAATKIQAMCRGSIGRAKAKNRREARSKILECIYSFVLARRHCKESLVWAKAAVTDYHDRKCEPSCEDHGACGHCPVRRL